MNLAFNSHSYLQLSEGKCDSPRLERRDLMGPIDLIGANPEWIQNGLESSRDTVSKSQFVSDCSKSFTINSFTKQRGAKSCSKLFQALPSCSERYPNQGLVEQSVQSSRW